MIDGKLSIAPGEMFFRAVLCNFFVCLAVACGTKCKEEAAKFLMIVICISGFVIAGFEHCIANMALFTAVGFMVPGVSHLQYAVLHADRYAWEYGGRRCTSGSAAAQDERGQVST